MGGPARAPVDLGLSPEHRRGHGALDDGLKQGRVDLSRPRTVLAALPLPRAADGRWRWRLTSARGCAQTHHQPTAAVLPRLWAGQATGPDDRGRRCSVVGWADT